MYIQEVIIDGFKSYATRTTVTGFDPYFNAITGLNGSGKSNILDSICFVLGISNLSQVCRHTVICLHACMVEYSEKYHHLHATTAPPRLDPENTMKNVDMLAIKSEI